MLIWWGELCWCCVLLFGPVSVRPAQPPLAPVTSATFPANEDSSSS